MPILQNYKPAERDRLVVDSLPSLYKLKQVKPDTLVKVLKEGEYEFLGYQQGDDPDKPTKPSYWRTILELPKHTTINERLNTLLGYYYGGNKTAFAQAMRMTTQSVGDLVRSDKKSPVFWTYKAFPRRTQRWNWNG